MTRTTGRPPSGNGASSFHLNWNAPPGHFVGAAVDFELGRWPATPDLVFWALQVSFADASGVVHGGAHLGVQWHPRSAVRTAACWGGYRNAGGELDGGPIVNAGSLGPNVCEFAFPAGTPVRFLIEPHPDGWAGRIDVGGVTTTLRVLFCAGDRLVNPCMWTECFAPCDAPSVSAAWFRPRLLRADGTAADVGSVSTSYQAESDGGCSNTNSALVRDRNGRTGIAQTTACERRTPHGTALPLALPEA